MDYSHPGFALPLRGKPCAGGEIHPRCVDDRASRAADRPRRIAHLRASFSGRHRLGWATPSVPPPASGTHKARCRPRSRAGCDTREWQRRSSSFDRARSPHSQPAGSPARGVRSAKPSTLVGTRFRLCLGQPAQKHGGDNGKEHAIESNSGNAACEGSGQGIIAPSSSPYRAELLARHARHPPRRHRSRSLPRYAGAARDVSGVVAARAGSRTSRR